MILNILSYVLFYSSICCLFTLKLCDFFPQLHNLLFMVLVDLFLLLLLGIWNIWTRLFSCFSCSTSTCIPPTLARAWAFLFFNLMWSSNILLLHSFLLGFSLLFLVNSKFSLTCFVVILRMSLSIGGCSWCLVLLVHFKLFEHHIKIINSIWGWVNLRLFLSHELLVNKCIVSLATIWTIITWMVSSRVMRMVSFSLGWSWVNLRCLRRFLL